MANSTSEWTYAEYARLPDDGNRYEVIDGEVCVTPAPGPKHQEVAANLFFLLRAHVTQQRVGKMLWDVDLLFLSGQYLRPDMVFVPAASLGGITDRGVESPPGLVVEVLSPHSRRIDLALKPLRYRDFGIPEYWVVDQPARSVHVFRFAVSPEEEIVTNTLAWQPEPGRPALMIAVGALFDDL